jgi:transcriptional regulator with XRE-family HTH domain
MDDVRLGQLFRAARIRRGWRQVDVATRAGVSQTAVSKVERGQLATLSLREVRTIAIRLEIQLDLTARWRGGEGARLLSARHGAMAEEVARRWPALGWVLRPEVSFSIWGERGVIDVLAWQPQHRAILVVELKTQLLDVGELLATLDRKRRLAPRVATELGWRDGSVSSCVLFLESRTNRRRLAQHAAVLRAALPADGRALRPWLVRPSEPIHALAFLPDSPAVTARFGSRGVQRVRMRPSTSIPPASCGAGRAKPPFAVIAQPELGQDRT